MSAVFAFTTYGGPEVQQLTERKAPTPGPDEIAIKVRAAGVNPADWKRREGAFGTRGALPVAMGLEAAGVVTAVGDGVDEFAVGDEVLGAPARGLGARSEEHTSELQSRGHLVCRLLLEKKKEDTATSHSPTQKVQYEASE